MEDKELVEKFLTIQESLEDLDNEVARLTQRNAVALAGCVGCLVLIGATNFLVNRLAKAMTGMSNVVMAHENFLTSQPRVVVPANGTVARHMASQDETIPNPEDVGPIAEPAMGPESEASQRVKEALANDPSASELLKSEGLGED